MSGNLLGRLRKIASHLAIGLSDTVLYLKHKVNGSNYAQFYEEKMDRHVKKNPHWGLTIPKKFQLDYLVNRGLKASTRFLDYGCGALSAGVHFVGFLDSDCYTGTDISNEALKEGYRRLESEGLLDKRPILIHIKGGVLDPLLATGQYDLIWAQSVLTHMPPDDISKLLSHMPMLLKHGGTFYATFAWTSGSPRQVAIKDWYYDIPFMEKVAKENGLAFNLMADWKHPSDEAGVDRLGAFTVNSYDRL